MIRFIAGFIILMGVAGGLDSASDSDLLYLLLGAAIGLALMLFGSNSMEKKIG